MKEKLTPEEFKKLYQAEFTPDPFHEWTDQQLRWMENNRAATLEARRRAKKIRLEREERNDHR